MMEKGVVIGIWKFYDLYGNFNKVGVYLNGKCDGCWFSGDFGNLKYMGDICFNLNFDNFEEIMSYQEKLFDIMVMYYQKGVVCKIEFYGINVNLEGLLEEVGE